MYFSFPGCETRSPYVVTCLSDFHNAVIKCPQKRFTGETYLAWLPVLEGSDCHREEGMGGRTVQRIVQEPVAQTVHIVGGWDAERGYGRGWV